MSDRQYGFDEVEASWTTPSGSLDLKEGITQDGGLEESQAAQAWSLRADGQGNGLYTKLLDDTGTLTVTVEQESGLNQKLLVRYNMDRTLGNQVGPIVVTDNSNGDVYVYTNARIMGRPNVVRGVSATTAQWVFGYTKCTPQPGDPTTNVIGA
jgi:hypothetical protein